MATITNYYEELGLNPEMSIEEIGSKLDQLETVWNQRMFNEPEKANNTLDLISEAREKFATDGSKADYDSSLENSGKEPISAGVPFAAIQDMMKKAMSFADTDQWDVAKISMDKVLSALGSADLYEEQEAAIYRYAGKVYTYNGLYSEAVDLENRAIALIPDNMDGYIVKTQTLDALISEMRKTGQDSSKAIEMLKKTSESWVAIARAQQDTEWTALGLETLAKSYLWALDYSSAYKFSSEAYAMDPEKKAGSGVLELLNQRRWPDIYELNLYYNEKSPFEDDIANLISGMVAGGLIPNDGLVITEKRSHNVEETEYYEDEQSIGVTFILNPDGNFIRKRVTSDKKWQSRPTWHLADSEEKTDIQSCSLNTVMMETDFDSYCESRTSDGNKTYFWWTKIVGEVSHSYQKVELTRFNSIKGMLLYSMLKDLVDKAAEQIERKKKYTEECNRINAAYSAELEPQKAKIGSDYASKRDALQREKAAAIEDAKRQEAQRVSIQNQINAMKNELSSLGFFAGKRKKELQANIDNLSRSLPGLATVSSVTSMYDKKAAELNQQEQNAISQLEKELRAKYPLPSLD